MQIYIKNNLHQNYFIHLLRSIKINFYIYEKFIFMADKNLARNVKELLKVRKMQQKELAEKMGVAASFLSNALTGNPTIETLQKMASALDVPVSVLLRERDYITGFVEVNGKGYRIDKWEDIQALISRHERYFI